MNPLLTQYEFGSLHIWDHPLEGQHYVIGIDTAEGKQRDVGTGSRGAARREGVADYSAAAVIERETAAHVATWHGTIPTTDWGYVVASLGYYYNQALLVPEINGPGLEVVNTLSRRLNYPNLYINKLFGNVDGDDLASRWGWRTNTETRPVLIARLEEALNHGRAFSRDQRLVSELRTMVVDNTGKARAKYPNHDDLAFAYALALQGRFEGLSNIQAPLSDPNRYEGLSPRDKRIWQRLEEQRARSSDGGDTVHFFRGGDRGLPPPPGTY